MDRRLFLSQVGIAAAVAPLLTSTAEAAGAAPVTLDAIAAEQLTSSKPRYVLQGCHESTGQWQPHEETLKLGKTEQKLMA